MNGHTEKVNGHAAKTNGNVVKPVFKLPSDERQEPGSVNVPPAEYPASINTEGLSPETVAADIVSKINRALEAQDYNSIANLFTEDSLWRDHLCLTWDLRTFQGPDKVLALLKSECRLTKFSLDKTVPHRTPQISPIDVAGKVQTVQFFITVSTTLGEGQGVIRLTQSNGYWRILTLFTSLKKLAGFEEPRGTNRPYGKNRGAQAYTGKNWVERRESERNFEESGPAVLVIGAGQAGLMVAARLKMLGVETLLIDRAERVGNNWRNRYRTLVLHDPVWANHLPYINFPDTWPIFTPKDKIADFFEAYVELLDLNVWLKTELVSSSWDDYNKHWTVTVERQVGDQKETRTFQPRHVIQATGHSGKKNFPDVKGMDTFKGRLCHSSEFSGAKPNSQGKRVVVVGACNSAHDIAQDYYINGYDVTMVQRSSTCIVTVDSIVKHGILPLYSETSPPVDDADLLNFSRPTPFHKKMHQELSALEADDDREKLEGLQKAGFAINRGPDYAGLMYKYFQNGGGYYIDVGASQLIIDGKIKIKHAGLSEVLADGIRFADGSELPADEIVFATGYQNMRTQARVTFGDQVGDRLRDVWGFDDEGEVRAMWRPSGHPGFWYMGGNLMFCRYYSLPLALQIKAYEAGLNKY